MSKKIETKTVSTSDFYEGLIREKYTGDDPVELLADIMCILTVDNGCINVYRPFDADTLARIATQFEHYGITIKAIKAGLRKHPELDLWFSR